MAGKGFRNPQLRERHKPVVDQNISNDGYRSQLGLRIAYFMPYTTFTIYLYNGPFF
jgi:hypothetical protein